MSSCAQLEGLKNEVQTKKNNLSSTSTYPEFQSYQAAVTNFESAISNCMDNGPLNQIGTLQQEIIELQKHNKTAQTELDIARTRHEAVMGGEKKVSDYQGVSAMLGFFKPLRESSVAVLIALGIFLIFLAIYVLSFLSKGGDVAANVSMSGLNSGAGLFAGFDKRSFLYGVGVVAVVVGTLAYFGLYGKGLN
jgi:hypothetical protein